MMKTRKGWQRSGQRLGEYLNVGDIVDEELEMYFGEVLPPTTSSNTVIQIGEAYDSDHRGLPRFATLEKIEGNWVYKGNRTKPEYWENGEGE